MKLIAKVNGVEKEVKIERDESVLVAEIDGRKYELEVSEPEKNLFLFKNEGKIFESFISPKNGRDEPYKVNVGPADFEIEIVDPKRLRSASGGIDNADGIAEIHTAMPGKVVKILVETDDDVSAGDGIIIVEAMKMQNELKSPKDGIVKQINFNEGDTVNAGDILVLIE